MRRRACATVLVGQCSLLREGLSHILLRGIAEGTVRVHVKAILRKIRVGNRMQATIWLMNNPASARAFNVAQLVSTAPPADRCERAVATGVDAIG